MAQTLWAGASGYAYKEWQGSFYPEKIAADAMLAWYAQRLPTVEINNTFYRMPKREVLAAWAAAVPAGFLRACINSDQGMCEAAPCERLMDVLRTLRAPLARAWRGR